MQYKTEQELLNSDQFIIYKMTSLYKSDPNSFKSAMDFIPFLIFKNWEKALFNEMKLNYTSVSQGASDSDKDFFY